MDLKSLFATRTFWLNVLVLPLAQLGLRYGITLDPDTTNALSIVLVAIANVVMRLFTKDPVTIMPAPKAPCWFLGLLLAGSLMVTLVACSAGAPTLAELCPAYQAAKPNLPSDPTTANLEAYAESVCDPATGQPLASAPADPQTPAWFAGILSGLKILAPIVVKALLLSS